MSLTDAELDLVTASIVRVGRTDNTGSITVGGEGISAPTTSPTSGWATLSLRTGGTVTQGSTGALSVTNLAVQAKQGADLDDATNTVTNVAFDIGAGTAGGFNLKNSGALTIGVVDGVTGIKTKGNVNLSTTAADAAINVNQAVTTNALGDVNLHFDNVAIDTTNGSITASTKRVAMTAVTSGQLFDLGGADSGTTLGLTTAEVNRITASVLKLGDSTAGQISVSTAISPTNVTTLSLETGAGITANAAITVTNLALRSSQALSFTQANNVTGSLAASVATRVPHSTSRTRARWEPAR